MFLANPVIENSLIIINAIRNPPIILNNEANRAVFAELIFISVSLWPRTSKAKGIVINPIISIGLNIISGVFIFNRLNSNPMITAYINGTLKISFISFLWCIM